MHVTLILAPYSLGHEGIDVGAGPDRLVEAGAIEALRDAGHDVAVERVDRVEAERREDYSNEVGASFEVMRFVAVRVGEVIARGSFPVVLTGNCLNSVGIVAGVGTPELGVVWFDAHADFSTPEGTIDGFLDSMGLSILTGTGWNALRETVPGYRPVPERNVVLAGSRDYDQIEVDRLEASDIAVVPPGGFGDDLDARLDALREHVGDVYLHLDLDVLDAGEGRVNLYAADGGPTAEEVLAAIGTVGERMRVRAAAVSAYDPACDPEGSIPPKAIRLLVRIVGAAADAAGGPTLRAGV